MNRLDYPTDLGTLHYLDSGLDSQEVIVFLHGFTGSSRDFLGLSADIIQHYRCLIPDLPGHGKTQVREDETFTSAEQVALLERWLDSLGQRQFHLFGYSMGGRLALQFAVKNSHQLKSLMLVSTTAGIKDETARLSRAKADEQLGQKILNSNPVDFLNSWLSQPLFQGITDKGQDFVNQEVIRRLPLQVSGLACSLKYFSSGVMPSVWHQLKNLNIPTLVIAGARDEKYLQIASQLVALLPNSSLRILPTSHAPILESPDLLWKQVIEFLTLLYFNLNGTFRDRELCQSLQCLNYRQFTLS